MNATTPRFVSPRRRRNETNNQSMQMAVALLGGLLLSLVVLFILSTGYSLVYFGRIFPGVSVAGVDVSGLTPSDAADKLNNALTYPYSGRIVFRDGANVWVQTPSQLGMLLDAASTAEAATQFGRDGNLFQNITNQFQAAQAGVDLSPVSVFDQRVAQQYLQGLAAQIDRPVADASLKIDGLDVSAQPGQPGRTLNVDATLIYLNVQLQFFRDGEVPLVITEKAPDIMDSSVQAEAARRLLSASLTLSLPDLIPDEPGPWQIPPVDLGKMLQVGRSGSQFVLQLDHDAIQSTLDEIAKKVNRRSKNARFVFNDKTSQLDLVQDAVTGLTMDVPGSLAKIEEAVAQGQQNVELKVSANQPQVGDDANGQQLGITELISSQTTYFYGSTEARMQNIKTAAAQFHGLLVAG